MTNCILSIFLGRAPADVRQVIVCGDPIEVSAHISLWPPANVSLQYQLMDRLDMPLDRMLLIPDIDPVISVVLAFRQFSGHTAAISQDLSIRCGIVSRVTWYLFDHRYAFRSPSWICFLVWHDWHKAIRLLTSFVPPRDTGSI